MESLDSGMARRLPQALAAAGLVDDDRLVAALLSRGSVEVQRYTATAVSHAADPHRSETVLDALVSTLTDQQRAAPEPTVALEALAASGIAGRRHLLNIAQDESRGVPLRLLALENLANDIDRDVARLGALAASG